MNIDYLKNWMQGFQHKYSFRYFICQMDNAGKDEYYFDSNRIGKIYDEIS